MKSILQTEKECYICGSQQWLENHHVFYGTANRKLSEKYGLTVYLCHNCHNEPPNGIHHNRKNDIELKQKVQKIFMAFKSITSDEFIQIFGRNYL